jgi:hypothetical protein
MVEAEINQAGAAPSSMEQSLEFKKTDNSGDSGDIAAIEWVWASETA